MSFDTINATISAELHKYPRAGHGSSQNHFRAVYQMIRAHSLGRKAERSWTAARCEAWALELIRRDVPEFELTVEE